MVFHRPREACGEKGENVVKYTVFLKENRQFRRLYAKGKSFVSPFLVLYYKKNGKNKNFLGITVSGKVGNAVLRNKLRRRIREIYRTNEERFLSGYTIVVVARIRSSRASYEDLRRSFLKLAKKANILRSEEE